MSRHPRSRLLCAIRAAIMLLVNALPTTRSDFRKGQHESPRNMRGFLVTLPLDFEQEGFDVAIAVRAKELSKQQESTLQVRVAMKDGGTALEQFFREA